MFVSKRTIVTLLLAVLTCSFLMAASTSTYNVTIESRIADGSGIEDGGDPSSSYKGLNVYVRYSTEGEAPSHDAPYTSMSAINPESPVYFDVSGESDAPQSVTFGVWASVNSSSRPAINVNFSTNGWNRVGQVESNIPIVFSSNIIRGEGNSDVSLYASDGSDQDGGMDIVVHSREGLVLTPTLLATVDADWIDEDASPVAGDYEASIVVTFSSAD